MTYIEVEKGVNIYVEDVNPGGGKPVVFLHGSPVNHNMFEYQFNQLPQYGFRCIGTKYRRFCYFVVKFIVSYYSLVP